MITIDKKECSKCGSKQAYDEVIKRKNNCNCGGKYRPAKSWATCGRSFTDRLEKSLAKKDAETKRIREEVRRDVHSAYS